MEIGTALAADLDLLTDALNDPDVDIAQTLLLMAEDARAAVSSFRGLSLVVTGLRPMTFTALEPGEALDIAASLMLPLLRSGDWAPRRDVSLILYSSRPGAFVDLAADLAWLTGLGSFTLDRHLTLPREQESLGVLRAESRVNQAIGVLIGRGLSPASAEGEITARAAAASTELHVVAEQILAGLDRTDRDTDPV